MFPDYWGSDMDYAAAMGTDTRERVRLPRVDTTAVPEPPMTADEIKAAFDALFASLDRVSAGRQRRDDEEMGAAVAARCEVTR